MKKNCEPGLYGIFSSNRSGNSLWGKNQFNSSFPVALACYMRDHDKKAVYLALDGKLNIVPKLLSFDKVFNSALTNEKLFFSFESKFEPYQKYSSDDIGGIDLVVKSLDNLFLRPLEIKLTVVPDSSTFNKEETLWGAEIVIRPATTKYCALGIADSCSRSKRDIRGLFEPIGTSIQNWGNKVEIASRLEDMIGCIDTFEKTYYRRQKPLLLQPIWKTQGQSPILADNAFDLFVWSDFALTRLFLDRASRKGRKENIERKMRSAARFFRFMYEFSTSGKAALNKIYTEMGFGKQTDKEFSVNGQLTHRYMSVSPRLKTPCLKSSIVKEIILNGGEELLKPERRFDQTLYYAAKQGR